MTAAMAVPGMAASFNIGSSGYANCSLSCGSSSATAKTTVYADYYEDCITAYTTESDPYNVTVSASSYHYASIDEADNSMYLYD